ncbi:MOSC domain-containing protein [Siminovitchia sediminis]|uniref:MOSC domain-containing protein n=1 Tax=Siminovitchia sediminis TaxID=1274353 RepID=A0ABW4KJ55_9BACI
MQVASLWRYPVKSMMGEEMNACDITEKGLFGDRVYGVVDRETGKLANAKNPKKWPNMFRYRAAFIEPPKLGKPFPPVRVIAPNGQTVASSDDNADKVLTESFQRAVTLSSPSPDAIEFEGYVPEEIEELDNRGSIFTRQSPGETFFDIGKIHIITTSTIDALRSLTPNSRVEPRRFRPNIILETPNEQGFIEQEWVGKTLTIGNKVQLKIVQPTKRCVMTTLAQGDLPKDINILRTLAKENDGNFGVYADIIQPGPVKIGDTVQVNE